VRRSPSQPWKPLPGRAELGIVCRSTRSKRCRAILDFFARGVQPGSRPVPHGQGAGPGAAPRLAGAAMLEHDTFSTKYEPDIHVWPLIERMVSHALDRSIDSGDGYGGIRRCGSTSKGGPGLVGFAQASGHAWRKCVSVLVPYEC
jgi:hypothetical protein